MHEDSYAIYIYKNTYIHTVHVQKINCLRVYTYNNNYTEFLLQFIYITEWHCCNSVCVHADQLQSYDEFLMHYYNATCE